MNARNDSAAVSPLPLVAALENIGRFPWPRAEIIRFWVSIKWAISVAARLTISFVLFFAGFMLAVATVLVALLRFAGSPVPVALLTMGAFVVLFTFWGSGACWNSAERAALPARSVRARHRSKRG